MNKGKKTRTCRARAVWTCSPQDSPLDHKANFLSRLLIIRAATSTGTRSSCVLFITAFILSIIAPSSQAFTSVACSSECPLQSVRCGTLDRRVKAVGQVLDVHGASAG